MCFKGETELRCCGGEGAVVTEKDEKEESPQGKAQGEHFPKAVDWETEVGLMRVSS